MTVKKISLLIMISLLVACKNDSINEKLDVRNLKSSTKSQTNNQNLNISFLLDLSDRIDPEKYPNEAMDYYQRDALYINSVAVALRSNLNSKRIRQIEDRVQLFFEPEPSNPGINLISEKLKFSFSKENVSQELLERFDQAYQSQPKKIYELAIVDNNYVGSDTWRFFKTKVDDYCIEEGYRNILVVLTDGYIYHKDTKIKQGNKTSYLTPEYIRTLKLDNINWKETYDNKELGYIPLEKDLSNLEVLVLGINPDTKNDFEEEVIRKFWSDWLEGMNVKRYKIMNAGLPSNMDEIIKDFI